MDRNHLLKELHNQQPSWDLIVIGGGASGLGTALDAASRGYRTLLLEQGDFAQATSSRSTKLVHGGVRYLRQLAISLVRRSLKERFILLQNAPHLVHALPFIIPTSNWLSRCYYLAGIKFYDLLARRLGFKPSHLISKKELLQCLPTIKVDQFSGGICYFDGQFDDARMAINLAQTIVEQGGVPINYMQVQGLLKTKDKVIGVIAIDLEKGITHEIQGKVVINASGVFIDSIRCMDKSNAETSIVVSQGSHIVLERTFFPGNSAMIIPETVDGRVIFAIPWYNRVLVGTTETTTETISLTPKPKEAEITYLLEYIGKYLTKQPKKSDILSQFSGLRALMKPKEGGVNTALLSRDYVISVSPSQLISVIGGKWTVYRKMGEETVDVALKVAQLPFCASQTSHLKIHGWSQTHSKDSEWHYYGSDLALVEQQATSQEQLQKLHPDLPCREVDVLWAIRHEMARTVEDVLSRRTRCLPLGARASIEVAPKVAAIMAKDLCFSKEWECQQVKAFERLAKDYLGSNPIPSTEHSEALYL